MRGILYPVFWSVGLGLGVFGTSFLYTAITTGQSSDLLIGLLLFIPGLYLSGQVLAHARTAHRRSRSSPSGQVPYWRD